MCSWLVRIILVQKQNTGKAACVTSCNDKSGRLVRSISVCQPRSWWMMFPSFELRKERGEKERNVAIVCLPVFVVYIVSFFS